MEAAGREAPAAPAAEALLSLGSDVRVGMGRDRASRLADSYVGGAGRSAAAHRQKSTVHTLHRGLRDFRNNDFGHPHTVVGENVPN